MKNCETNPPLWNFWVGGMCVFESGTDPNSSPSNQDSDISTENESLLLETEQTLDRTLQHWGSERVSLIEQQDTTTNDADASSELKSALLNSVTISISTSEDAELSISSLKTNANLADSFAILNRASDHNDEDHFDISPQVSLPESVFVDEKSQNSVQMGGGTVTSQVMPPNNSPPCAPDEMPLPLSPKDTEEFDEMKSLEAINVIISPLEGGQVALSSDLQSVDTTPFVKEELKEKIKLRRKKKGLPTLKVHDDQPKPDVLTAEEEEKRRHRRERNRIAAAKCRRKKKAKAIEKKKVSQSNLEQRLALLDEMSALMEEKARLQAMLKSHLRECARRDVILVEVPELNSIQINPLELFDSDSTEDDPTAVEMDESSDAESVDLTEDISDHVINSSLAAAVSDETELSADTAENLQQAVVLLNSLGGDCFSTSANLDFEYLPPS